jgi:hypothetical protein
MRGAEVVGAPPALVALHAAVDGFDHDCGPVLSDTRQLVTEHGAAPETDVTQVGATDAGRPHVEELSDAGRLANLDDGHASLDAAYCLHDRSSSPTGLRLVRGPDRVRRSVRHGSGSKAAVAAAHPSRHALWPNAGE